MSCCLSVIYWKWKPYHKWAIFNSPYSLCKANGLHHSTQRSQNSITKTIQINLSRRKDPITLSITIWQVNTWLNWYKNHWDRFTAKLSQFFNSNILLEHQRNPKLCKYTPIWYNPSFQRHNRPIYCPVWEHKGFTLRQYLFQDIQSTSIHCCWQNIWVWGDSSNRTNSSWTQTWPIKRPSDVLHPDHWAQICLITFSIRLTKSCDEDNTRLDRIHITRSEAFKLPIWHLFTIDLS